MAKLAFVLILVSLMAVAMANGYFGKKGSQGYLTTGYDKGYPPEYYNNGNQPSSYETKGNGYGTGYPPTPYANEYSDQPTSYGNGYNSQPTPYDNGYKGQPKSYGMSGSNSAIPLPPSNTDSQYSPYGMKSNNYGTIYYPIRKGKGPAYNSGTYQRPSSYSAYPVY